jgi:uncharacterized integral membrane protein (TIGR00698 family)
LEYVMSPKKILIFGILLLFAWWRLSAHVSLMVGLLLALSSRDFFKEELPFAKKATTKLLQLAIVLLGATLPIGHLWQESKENVLVTFFSITAILLLGSILNRKMKLPQDLSVLLSVGTAICGGSAIAAIAPVIGASGVAISVSLGLVFLFNASSVYLFPAIGSWLQLSPEQFGIWSAIAIHDTASVLAAAAFMGEASLQTATTVKLTRALWIIPLCFYYAWRYRSKAHTNHPWFILSFVGMSCLFSFAPMLAPLKPWLQAISKTALSCTLFLIGLQLNRDALRTVGIRPFLYASLLWLTIACGSLGRIVSNS